MFGPSLGERSGSGCVSQNRPSTPERHRGPGQRLDHRPVAAGRAAQAARLLHAVRGVEDHRHAEGLHLRESPACRSPAGRSRKTCPARRAACSGSRRRPACRRTCRMSPGAMNWPFFTCTARPVLRGRHQQIGLPGEERGDLQQVADLADRRGLLRLVDVGRHRQAGRCRGPAPGSAALRQARAAIGVEAGAVGLVERGLEHQLHRQIARVAASRSAIASVSASLSITHGPAITSSGSPAPQRYGPI